MRTLRGKITLMVSFLLIATMGLLTVYSIMNSNRHFVTPMKQLLITEVNKIDTNQVRIVDKATIVDKVFPAYSIKLEPLIPLEERQKFTAAISTTTAKAQKEFGVTQLFVMLLIVSAGILLTNFLVGRALRPLSSLSKTAGDIDAHKLSTQIAMPSSQDEVGALTNSFNSMLMRLNSSFELQKNFTQNAAHELKTPLAVIKSSLQVLALDDEPSLEDYRENAKIIAQSTDDLIEIVAGLLALTESVELECEELSLDDIIDECLKTHSADIEKIGIKVNQQLKNHKIYANHVLVESIFNNILSNGIKYNKQGGTLSICTNQIESGTQILISDTGIGMSAAELPCIFEPFYRADQSRSKKIDGNGLGLAIVKVMVDKLGGKIEVNSEIGVGTTVKIELP